jgi:hypothetical protein
LQNKACNSLKTSLPYTYMTELDILHTESRIEQIKSAIAQTRAKSTNATRANDEMAIEMIAIPELRKAEKRLAELTK